MTIFARFTPGILRACLLGLLLTPQLVTAQSISDLTLGDALAAALANDTSGDQPDSPPYQASSWLAGLPSASLTYLGSDERYGTDETVVYSIRKFAGVLFEADVCESKSMHYSSFPTRVDGKSDVTSHVGEQHQAEPDVENNTITLHGPLHTTQR